MEVEKQSTTLVLDWVRIQIASITYDHGPDFISYKSPVYTYTMMLLMMVVYAA